MQQTTFKIRRKIILAFLFSLRELQNIIERAVALAEGDTVTLADLPPDFQELAPSGDGSWPTLEAPERDYIQKVLAFTNHQTGESTRILNLPRTILWRKMKKYGLTKT